MSAHVLQGKSDMDNYLSTQPQPVVNSKILCREGAPLPEPFFLEDFSSPFSVNMSLLLPDITYLHPGVCRTVRQIKPEPSHSLMPSACQSTRVEPTLSAAVDAPSGNFFIKQEVSDFQDVPLFQLLNSDLEQLVHGSPLNSVPMVPVSLPSGNVHVNTQQNPSKTTNSECFQFNQRQQQRPTYLPPSPPNSEPPSPNRNKGLLHNFTPPPSYEATIASKLTFHTQNSSDQSASVAPVQGTDQNSGVRSVQSPNVGPTQDCGLTPVQTTAGVGPLSPVLAQSAPVKSNRRTNPDLEKRRIHHCDVPG